MKTIHTGNRYTLKTKPLTQKNDRKGFAMFERNWFILAVACGAVLFLGASSDLRADEEKNGGTLNLESAYFEKAIVTMRGNLGAKTVGLEAKLDGKGGGTGKLTLDPNLKQGRASTAIGIWFVKVNLKEVRADESAKKGRQLYEVSGQGMEPLLPVSVPTKGDGPCWLLIGGKDGIEDMIEMQRK